MWIHFTGSMFPVCTMYPIYPINVQYSLLFSKSMPKIICKSILEAEYVGSAGLFRTLSYMKIDTYHHIYTLVDVISVHIPPITLIWWMNEIMRGKPPGTYTTCPIPLPMQIHKSLWFHAKIPNMTIYINYTSVTLTRFNWILSKCYTILYNCS